VNTNQWVVWLATLNCITLSSWCAIEFVFPRIDGCEMMCVIKWLHLHHFYSIKFESQVGGWNLEYKGTGGERVLSPNWISILQSARWIPLTTITIDVESHFVSYCVSCIVSYY
jgi:hypothetical protein